MNKTKYYRNGSHSGRAYCKSVGKGFEVGFYYDGKCVFVGNFIHTAEATSWWTHMNREIKTFSKKFKVGKTFPASWFTNFLNHHLYKSYYSYLDRVFTKYQKEFTHSYTRDVRTYRKLNRKWQGTTKTFFLKAA